MPYLSRITNTFFVTLINRLGVRPPPPEGFELSNVVQPVSIVDSDIAIASIATTPLLSAPFTIGESAAPADLTVLADTGAQAVGNWDVTIMLSASDAGVGASGIQIQRRDAANATNIWAQRFNIFDPNNLVVSFRTPLALNERIRVMKTGAAGAGTVYQASIWLTLST